jgi:hypothetical protein
MKIKVKRVNGKASMPVSVVIAHKKNGRIEKGEFEKEMDININDHAKLTIEPAYLRTKYR